VTSREERDALNHLRDLLTRDLSKEPVEELVAGIREAELTFDEAQQWCGRLVAELRRRELSWGDVAKLTDVAPTTLRNRVAKAEGARPAGNI
jgi:hypothetical protein